MSTLTFFIVFIRFWPNCLFVWSNYLFIWPNHFTSLLGCSSNYSFICPNHLTCLLGYSFIRFFLLILFVIVYTRLALDVHYESQCIPTPASWYFHHLPQWFNRLSVALTFYIELYLPPLFMVGSETVRLCAGIPQVCCILNIFQIFAYSNFISS